MAKDNEWHDYDGDAYYEVGKHGLSATNDLTNLVRLLNQEPDSEENEDWVAEYDVGEGAVILVNKLTVINNQEEDIYAFQVFKDGGDIPFDMLRTVKGPIYYGTDHMVFGSGNVKKIQGR